VIYINSVSQCLSGGFSSHHKLRWLMAITGIVLLYLACSITPASAYYDCDPFDGSSPQSSKKCPCSDQPNSKYYCASAVQYTVFEITEKVRALFLSILETIARVLWLAARFIANLAEALLRGQVWQAIREGILEQLQALMGGSGGVLARVTGGGNGLFLVALLLAGLVMTFPLLGASRLVQADRVILWGVVLFALFIGGTQGFDLTNAIENLRVQMIETIAEGDNEAGLIDLVARPVGATADEARQLNTDDLMTLPRIMIQSHFIGLPEGSRCQGGGGGADECQKYRVIAFETNIAGQDLEYMFTAVKYKPDVIEGRQKQYTSGLVRMVVTLLAALVLLLFGIVFALLTAASLVLIIFFVAMLPLGFFEFGGAVLSGLMRQYTSVVGLSLFIAVMVRLMEGVTGTIFGAVSDFSDVLGLLTYLGMLLIIGLGLQMAVRTAWGLMDGTFTVLRASVQTVGSMAFAIGGGPLDGIMHMGAGKSAYNAAPNTAVNAAMATGAGLAAGGLGIASIAGSGERLSGSQFNNQVVDVKEHPSPAVSGALALTNSTRGNVSQDNLHSVLMGRNQSTDASRTDILENGRLISTHIPSKWSTVDRGSWITPDLSILRAAEQAYFDRSDPRQAFLVLERAFSSRTMADEVLGAYEIQGKTGAAQVRQVVETTQDAADDLVQHEQPIFDERGSLTPTCESAVLNNLRRAGLYDDYNLHQSGFVGRVAGATLRSPVDVWHDPQAPRKLARDTLDPEHYEVQFEDLSAQYRLRDVAKRMDWDEDKVTGAFAALPQAEQMAVQEGFPVVTELVEEWLADPQFIGDDETDLREAARLVVLVGSQAQVQKSHPMPGERADLIPPVATMTREAGGIVVTAPYSARLNQQFKDNLPPRDYHWDVERAEWQISPEHELGVQKILDEVAEENGWRVEDDQEEENVSNIPAESVNDAGSLEHFPDTEVESTGEQAMPNPQSGLSAGENADDPDVGHSPEPNNQENKEPVVEAHPETSQGSLSDEKNLSDTHLPDSLNLKIPATPTLQPVRTSHISSDVTGSIIQTDNHSQAGKRGNLPVPDATVASASPNMTPKEG
jgi:hypothetical protein